MSTVHLEAKSFNFPNKYVPFSLSCTVDRQHNKTLLHYFIMNTATEHLKVKGSGFIGCENMFFQCNLYGPQS